MIRAVAVRQRSQAPAELLKSGGRVPLGAAGARQCHPRVAHRSALGLVLALPPGEPEGVPGKRLGRNRIAAA